MRQIGKTQQLIESAADVLKENKPVWLVGRNKDTRYLDRVINGLKLMGIIVAIEETYRWEPAIPIKHTYDRFGEITSTFIVEQTKVHNGWILTTI